jgi:hypothetical protein
MQTSVSKGIVEKWLEKLAERDVDPLTVELLRNLANNDELQSSEKLKGVIAAIEKKYAKDQDT